jgi:hypothetical protein
MKKVIAKQIEYAGNKEKQIFWVAFSMFVMLIISYGYFVNQTFQNASMRENMNKEISVLSTDVNTLEYKYLNIKNNINMNLAVAKGFVSVKNENFASVSSKSLSLSVNKR